MMSTTPNGSDNTKLFDGRFNRFVDAVCGSIHFERFFSALLISAVRKPVSVTQHSSGLFLRSVYKASCNAFSYLPIAFLKLSSCCFLKAYVFVTPLSKYW